VPVPGPRNQYGPLPGYTNPDGELPDRFNLWGRPPPVAAMGMSPGLMHITLRGCVLGAGQVRRMWKQTVNYIAGPPGFSWSQNRVVTSPTEVVGLTRHLRYMTRSFAATSGTDKTGFDGLHTKITPQIRSKPVTLGAGQARSRPTVRNRITSFGSRVPTINQPIDAAETVE
jgi:hypothetical protein